MSYEQEENGGPSRATLEDSGKSDSNKSQDIAFFFMEVSPTGYLQESVAVAPVPGPKISNCKEEQCLAPVPGPCEKSALAPVPGPLQEYALAPVPGHKAAVPAPGRNGDVERFEAMLEDSLVCLPTHPQESEEAVSLMARNRGGPEFD